MTAKSYVICRECGVRRAYKGRDTCRDCRRKQPTRCMDCGGERDTISPRCADCRQKREEKRKTDRRVEARYCTECGVHRTYTAHDRCQKCRLRPANQCRDCNAPRDSQSPRCADCRRAWRNLKAQARQPLRDDRPGFQPCPRCGAPRGLITAEGMTICETCGYMPDDPERLGGWIVTSAGQRDSVRDAVAGVKAWAVARGLDPRMAVNANRLMEKYHPPRDDQMMDYDAA